MPRGRRYWAALVALALALVGVGVYLIVTWKSIREGFAHTAPLADWLVALGTGGLALGTFVLALATRGEAAEVKRQVEIEAEQLVASQRPLVLPQGGDDVEGTPHLFIQNAGSGPAINVRGALYWTGTAGGASSLHPVAIAAGETDVARVLGEGIDVNWTNAVGFLRYQDIAGREWQTHFRFRVDGAGNISVRVLLAGSTEELGDPAYNADVGWVNRPEEVALWEAD